MPTASTAKDVASNYLVNDMDGSIANLEFVGMTDCPEGVRLGYEIKIDQGYSTAGAFFGAILYGLLVFLLTLLMSMILLLVGFPPSILYLIGFVLVLGAMYIGWNEGRFPSEFDRVTVTLNDSADVLMVNTDLSKDEFNNAIGRKANQLQNRQSSQVNDAIAQASKHWFLHKLADKFLGLNNRD